METVTHNVSDLNANERTAVEQLVGHGLRENQQIILQVITLTGENETEQKTKPNGQLPDWCNVFDGLSDTEIEEIETVILDRSGWGRSS